jgi:hypothetical protein
VKPTQTRNNGKSDSFAGVDTESIYADEGWLEHLEDELDPNLKEDLKLLLRNSNSDRLVLEELKSIRVLIKSSDEMNLPESGFYYEALHDKIMASIAEADDAKPVSRIFSIPARIRSMSRTTAGAAGLTLMMGLVAVFTIHGARDNMIPTQAHSVQSAADFERKLASFDPSEDESASDSMLSVESEGDFVVAAAVEKFKTMAPEQVDRMLKTLKY